MITIFTGKSDNDLQNINNELTKEFRNIFFNDMIPKEEKLNTIKKQEYKLLKVQYFVKEFVYRKLKELALIQTLAMQKKNDWGVMGEERVMVSFCRNIMNVPSDMEVTYFSADCLHRILNEVDLRYEYKSGDEYIEIIKNWSLEIFGRKYTLDNLSNINKELLELLDANYYVYVVNDRRQYKVEFIFGEMVETQIEEHKVFLMKEEFIRSPQWVLTIVARVFGDSTVIREEAYKVVFFNKWQRFYAQSKLERRQALRHPNSSIREGLKERALLLYDAASVDDVIKIKDTFIKEMVDGIIFHEYGHHHSYDDMEPIHYASHSSFRQDGNIIHVIPEAFADWKGAMPRFCELAAKNDVKRASRCYLVYMNDNWFVDEEEEFLPLMSYVLVGLAISFIETDGSVNFKRLTAEVGKIYSFLLDKFKNVMNELLDVIRNSEYDLGIKQLNFTQLENELFEMYKQSKKVESLDKLRTYNYFWVNVMEHLKKFSKGGWEQFQAVLKNETVLLEQDILTLVSGKENKYKTLREYIIYCSMKTGIMKLPRVYDVQAIVHKACSALQIPVNTEKDIQKKFEEIAGGKNYDFSKSFKGEKRFYNVLQEMLIKSDYENIQMGIEIGEYYSPDDSEYEREKYIRDELEDICLNIEKHMYPVMFALYVNIRYPISRIVEECLSDIKFRDGKTLAQKVKSIEYTFFEIDSPALMRVSVQTCIGNFNDWNTTGAVVNINKELRPNEFMNWWIVDRDFVEELFEKYNKVEEMV